MIRLPPIPRACRLREDFKRTFMDNWIDGRGFVIISY